MCVTTRCKHKTRVEISPRQIGLEGLSQWLILSISNVKQSAATILQPLDSFASMFIDYVIDMLLEAAITSSLVLFCSINIDMSCGRVSCQTWSISFAQRAMDSWKATLKLKSPPPTTTLNTNAAISKSIKH